MPTRSPEGTAQAERSADATAPREPRPRPAATPVGYSSSRATLVSLAEPDAAADFGRPRAVPQRCPFRGSAATRVEGGRPDTPWPNIRPNIRMSDEYAAPQAARHAAVDRR